MAFNSLVLPYIPSPKWILYDWPEFALNRDFGVKNYEDLFNPVMLINLTGRNPAKVPKRSGSRTENDPNMYSIKLDVRHFLPNEITVKTKDKNIIVTGKHEERKDDHGWISREFTRRYPLPEGCEEETVSSSLTPDGILMIEAPKKLMIDMPKENERIVPIIMKRLESIEAPEEKKAVMQ